MADFIYPTNQELRTIAQKKLPTLTRDDIIFDYFPVVDEDSDILAWEQEDDYAGLQQIRGLNGQPKSIQALGGKRFIMEPGYYGEFRSIDEAEKTRRRQWGTFDQPVSLEDLVMKAQDRLLGRENDRIRWVLWQLVSKATFTVLDGAGQIKYAGEYTDTPFDSSVAWSDLDNATPLADIRAATINEIGHSAKFDSNARLALNGVDASYLFGNRNANDFGGRRTNISMPFGLSEINQILVGENLPQIEVYNRSYTADNGVPIRFLETGRGVIFGRREDGGSIGDYAMTRNAINDSMAPGAYDYVYQMPEPPKETRVHRGHNGGPRLYFPSAIKRLTIG